MSLLSRVAGGATRVVRLIAGSRRRWACSASSWSRRSPRRIPQPCPRRARRRHRQASAGPASPSAGPASPSAEPSNLPSPGASLSVAPQNTCYTCHTAIDNTQHDIAQKWKDSVHGQNGIGCADCHGGDPTSDEVTVAMSTAAGFIGKPDRATTVGVCGNCHSDVERMRQYQLPTDQLVKYRASVHGQRLLTAQDTRVAICTDCHGVHDVKKASDPTAPGLPAERSEAVRLVPRRRDS